MDGDAATDRTVPALRWPRFPYPGLRPFQITAEADESLIFYGRDRHKDEIIGRLGRAHLVMVIGPSGCGKSSLIKAGVIPALEAGFLARAGERWRTAQMRPGRRPIAELARAFARIAVPDDGPGQDEAAAEQEELLRSGPSGLWLATGQLRDRGALGCPGAGNERLLVLLDQFEELFGPQIEDRKDVDDFVRLLVRFFEKPHQDLYLVVTMRTGYIGEAANFVGLAELLNATMYLTPVLNGDELREAITLPAQDYGGEVEPALVEAMLADMGTGTQYDADHLPLLQHALLWLWLQALPPNSAAIQPEQEDTPGAPARLTLAAYNGTGRLRGILDRHAEEVLAAAVSPDPKRLTTVVEAVFRRLTERDLGARYRRSPTTLAELERLTGCSVGKLADIIAPFADASASLLELRPPEAAPDSMVDVSHESLIRQWPRLRGWADAEATLRERFQRLEDLAADWSASGRRLSSTLRGSNLALAKRWYDATAAYRAQPNALAAWAHSRPNQADEAWAEPFGGTTAAVDALYNASMRARWARRGLWGVAVVSAVVVAGLFSRYVTRIEEEQGLTRLADLYGVAVANRDLPIGTLPPQRRATAYQELAALLGALEEPQAVTGTESHRNRLQALEGEADRTVRQILERTVEPFAPQRSPSIESWHQLVGACVRRSDPGARRQVVQVALAPLGASGSAGIGDLQPVFAMLTQVNNRPHLETVQFEKLAVGHAFSPRFAPIFCSVGRDRTPLDVTGAADVSMDPTARWLVERPTTSRGDARATARIRQLDWFRICLRPDEQGGCAPSDRQWHVELRELGPNVDLQQAELVPRSVDRMPAVVPEFLDGDAASALATAFSRPSDANAGLHTAAVSSEAGDGDALLWDDSVLVPARAGFRIPAFMFAKEAGLLAYVATTLAPNAKAAATSQGATTCDGQELCTHYLRVLHWQPENVAAEAAAGVPFLDLQFVGPPIDAIAFGEGELSGDLLFRFAGLGSAARLAWDRRVLKQWICSHLVAETAVRDVGGYTRAFENFVTSGATEKRTKASIIDDACQGS